MPEASPPPTTPAGEPATTGWSWPHRVFFRFVCCYFLIYTLPSRVSGSILEFIPGMSTMDKPYARVWGALVKWVTIHIFQQSALVTTYFQTGSSDTTLCYVENCCYLVFAFLGTMIWSLLDRKRTEYSTLHAWLRLWLRFILASAMFVYGFQKVFLFQMEVYLPSMVERWGDFSPMAALWSFMAASKPYEILSGAAEVVAGLLLLFRRTTLLGAIISLAVILNVVALNYCYDVPVKLFATNIALMASFLLAPDLRRLTQLLLLNRPTLPADLSRPVLHRCWIRISVRLLWVFAVSALLYGALREDWSEYKVVYLTRPKTPIYGLYEVETFTRNGAEAPPLLTDATRWHWLYAGSARRIVVIFMNDQRKNFGVNLEPAKNTVTLSSDQAKSVFIYSWTDTNHLVLRGSMAGDTLEVRLRNVPPSSFPLLNRGFHWINEVPFNH
jgi:uncharacterized membrane protein YphA (DoxX/SURF4 family)